MTIPEDYRNLIASLTERTSEGKLDWKSGKPETAYFASFGNFSVAVNQVAPRSFAAVAAGQPEHYRVSLFNEEGKEIDSFSVFAADDADFQSIRALWNTARRRALRVHQAIRQIEEQLEGLKDNGHDKPPP